MKKLNYGQFGAKKDRMFSLTWLGYRAAYPKHSAGYEQMKLCNRIGEKLEQMSKEAPTPQDAAERLPTKSVLLLDGHEHEKLLAMLKSEEVGWTYLAGKEVEVLIEAMVSAPEVEVEEKVRGRAKKKGKR